MRFLALALASAIPAALFSTPARAADAPNDVPPAPPPAPTSAPPPAAYPYAYDAPPPADPYDIRYPNKSAGIFLQPLGILSGTLGAEVDFKLASAITLNVEGDYTSSSLRTFDRTSGADAAAWAIDIGPQFFPFGRAFNQLYVYPRFSYVHAWATSHDASTGDISATASGYGFATTVGYQWTYVSGFSLRLGAGVAYVNVEGGDASTSTVRVSGLLPALDASLGWTF